jgi:glycosyltransferase involved in cell wall biosynthesis
VHPGDAQQAKLTGQMKTILYVKPADSSFILNDQKILEKSFRVRTYLMDQRRGRLHFLLGLFRLSLFIARNSAGSGTIITWFADYHAAVAVFLGKILGLKTIIIAGGQEAICYPELRKGVYYKRFRGACVKFALRNASLIIPNHESLVLHRNFYYDPGGKPDGIRYYIPDLGTKIEMVPNGIDTDKFYHDRSIEKIPGLVLTVGTINKPPDFINKGFDLFVELARRNPALSFAMIGVKKHAAQWLEDNYHTGSIPNFDVVYSFCPDEVLFRYYNRAKVFVQASITEGMPNTLSEAMLCECIPVGSDINGIPDAIGGCGVIVKKRDVAELESAVLKALQMSTGADARQHVLDNFSLELRESRLTKVILDQIS